MKRMVLVSAFVAVVVSAFSLAEAKEFLVGVDAPLTGSAARVGTGSAEGIKVAAEIFNRKNPNHKMTVQIIDNEYSPSKAVAAVEKLAAQKAVGHIAAYGLVGPSSAAAEKLGVVYVTATGPTRDLTQRGFKKFFSIVNGEGYYKITDKVLSQWNTKSVSIIYSTINSMAENAQDTYKGLTAKGIKVYMHPFDDKSTQDFKPIINKIKVQERPEVIYMIGLENNYVGILRAANVLKPNVKAIIGAWGMATAKMAKDFPTLVPNVFGTALIAHPAKFTTREGIEFHDTYKKMFNKEPDYVTLYGYVPAMVLFEAIKRADEKGTLERGGLAEEVRKTDRETLMGRVTFNERGENTHFTQRMGQFQDGKIVIVAPQENATAKMNYPALPWQ